MQEGSFPGENFRHELADDRRQGDSQSEEENNLDDFVCMHVDLRFVELALCALILPKGG